MANQKGMTLLEMSIAALLTGVILTAFTQQVIGISTLTANARLEIESNSLKSDLRAHLRHQPSARRGVLALIDEGPGGALVDCMRGTGMNCKTYGKLPWKKWQNRTFTLDSAGKGESGYLHEFYNLNGPCESKDTFACPWSVQVHSRWVCEADEACQGIELLGNIVTRLGDGKEETSFKYSKFWNSHDLNFAADLNYQTCNDRPIQGVDFARRRVLCGQFAPAVVCDGRPIVGTGPGDCGAEQDMQSFGVCTLAFDSSSYSGSGPLQKEDLKVLYTSQGENMSRMNLKCTEDWTPAEGFVLEGDRGVGVLESQAEYLRDAEMTGGTVGVLRREVLPGKTEIKCTGELLKQDQSPAGNCYATLRVTLGAPGATPVFETGEQPLEQQIQREPAQETTEVQGESVTGVRINGNGGGFETEQLPVPVKK